MKKSIRIHHQARKALRPIAASIALAIGPAHEARAQGAVRSVHNDWQIRCDTPPGSQGEQCALLQSVTAEDLLAAHRTPPQLLGIVPKNTGGFGNVNDAAAVFYEMEIMPIQRRMLAMNDWLGVPAVAFERPAIALPVRQAGPAATGRT